MLSIKNLKLFGERITMLKICTVYFDGFYTPDYVERLHDSLRKHSSIDFQFVCISDTDVKADLVLPYNHHSEVKKLIDKVVDKNQDILNKVIDLVSKTIINDKIIHAFGTGHSHMIVL